MKKAFALLVFITVPLFVFPQSFQEVTEGLPDLGSSAAVWADFNSDGLLDVAVTGIDGAIPNR